MKKENVLIDEINYKILNPGGNTTALIYGGEYSNSQKKTINKLIMEKYSQVEQVGFLRDKINRLDMAGGEFCLNATRCAVYEYYKKYKSEIEISVSGTDKKIRGKVLKDHLVEIKLDICKNIEDLICKKSDYTCINIDGILIVIVNPQKSKEYIRKLRENEKETKIEIKQLLIREFKTEEKAIGIMFLEKVSNQIKINPVVWVKDIDTVFYETACGSGSLGTAIYNYYINNEEKIELIQPSGYCIDIELEINGKYLKSAVIRGTVLEEKLVK